MLTFYRLQYSTTHVVRYLYIKKILHWNIPQSVNPMMDTGRMCLLQSAYLREFRVFSQIMIFRRLFFYTKKSLNVRTLVMKSFVRFCHLIINENKYSSSHYYYHLPPMVKKYPEWTVMKSHALAY